MADAGDIYAQFRAALRERHITCDDAPETLTRYATDESVFAVMPKLVVFPRTAAEVEHIVACANEIDPEGTTLSLTARAAGTGLAGGSLNDSVIIDMCRHFTELGALETRSDGTACARTQVGVMFRDLDAYTKRHGYFLPSYPSSRDICTIGGMIANNAAGPYSLKYGHTAQYICSLDVVLHDAHTYTFTDLTYDELKAELKRKDVAGDAYRAVWRMLEEEYAAITAGKPKASKNSSGYALWSVLQADSLDAFKNGEGTFSLVPLCVGSQGTLGIIVRAECRVIPVTVVSDLLVVPVAKVKHIGALIETTLEAHPCNVEIFDNRTYELAKRHPLFFKHRFYPESWRAFVSFLWQFARAYVTVFNRTTPAFTVLITFDAPTVEAANAAIIPTRETLEKKGFAVHRITNARAKEMLWNIRFASYSLAKLGKDNRRPAAFLEDIVVPPKHMGAFLKELTAVLKTYKAEYAMHGHGGNGHFHFYPLLDFTNPETPDIIMRMAEDVFALAEKYEGDICGEHNDGIIRTSYTKQMFSKQMLSLFRDLECAFDPHDRFNPGKKVNPKFAIIEAIRTTN